MNKRILILAKFDSFARVAKRVADGFAARGFVVDYRLISAGREALSSRIYREIGLLENTPVTTVNALFQSGELAEFAAVYLGATGGFIRNFLGRMKNCFPDGTPRPLIIAGYPGVILRDKLSGFANRCGCDFILLNSVADLEDYRLFCRHYGLEDGGARVFGYAFPPFHREKRKEVHRVLFVEQAAIPSSLRERLYLVRQLASYASTHPERKVIIKPRLIPGEKSVFTTKHHIEYILKSLPNIPGNVCVDYTNIQQLLEKTDLCLTLSSSVALQSMWYGIPTGIIRDFGIRDEYGTDFFRESGCLISFSDLAADKFPVLCQKWFHKNFTSYTDTIESVVNDVEEKYINMKSHNNWKKNKNFDIMFSDTYQKFQIEKNINQKKYRYFYLKILKCLVHQGTIVFQSLKRKECL